MFTMRRFRSSFLLPALFVSAVPAMAAPAASHGAARAKEHGTVSTTNAIPDKAASSADAGHRADVNSAQWPSFLVKNEVICFDELDFNAFEKTGRFHTRGSQESCTRVGELTRVVVLAQSGQKSQVLMVSGPLESHVGWTNGQLPIAGPKPVKH